MKVENQGMRKEVYETLDCYHVCTETIQHCIEMGGKHAEPKHLNLMMDCAQVCLTMANFIMRDSEYCRKLAPLCAEICEVCAASCASLGDEAGMQRCVDSCKTCAQTCKSISG